MINSNKLFFPNLDGLRFFAFFAVFINHASHSLGYNNNNSIYYFIKTNLLANGDMGVCFFFVLSGFLITYLLLEEKNKNDRINIKNFYLRRVLRIWPLYFFIVALCLLVFPLFENHLIADFPIRITIKDLDPAFYLTFTGNFDYIYNGVTNFLIGILWSISIEEQFYVLWPLVIAFIPRKQLMFTFICIIVAAVYFRFYYADGKMVIINFHSLSRMSDLAMGGVIALLTQHQRFIERIQRIPKLVIILVYCIGLTLILCRMQMWKFDAYFAYLTAALAPVIFSAFFAFIILEQNYSAHSVYKTNKLKMISSWGKFTYGMYCYHMIVFFLILFFIHLKGVKIIGMDKYTWVTVVFVSFFATLLISKLSYRYLEAPFLRMKMKFSPSQKKFEKLPETEQPNAARLKPIKVILITLVFLLPFIYSYYEYRRDINLIYSNTYKETIRRITYENIINQARLNIKQYQPIKNFSILSNAIRLYPNNPLAYADLGATYSMIHLYQKSIDACTKALKIDSTSAMAKEVLKLAIAEKSKVLLMIQEQEKVTIEDRDADFYNEYGFNYLMIGNYNKSLEIWNHALQSKSYNTMTLNNLGTVYMFKNQFDSAILFFQKANQLEPKNPQVQANLTWALNAKRKGTVLPMNEFF